MLKGHLDQLVITDRGSVAAESLLSFAPSKMIDYHIVTMMKPSIHSTLFAISVTFDLSQNRYSTFVRIGSGLSFADYVWVRDKPWQPYDHKNPPSWLLASKKGQDDKGDVYLEPEQ